MKKLQILIIGVMFLLNASGAGAFQATVIRLDYLATPSGTTQTIKQAGKYLQSSPAVNFSYTGALQQYTVPTTGSYQVTVSGAQGGGSGSGGSGGLGATVSGTIWLSAGTVLNVVVGGQGGSFFAAGGGGGGGSFVYVDGTNTLLLAAGGGGGGVVSSGGPGVAGTAGSSAVPGGAGGVDGSGGSGGQAAGGSGGGGAGWLSSGGNGGNLNSGSGGNTKPTFTGGSGFGSGGYGGGGSGGGSGGGGGGGYSGGGGANGLSQAGGGGGGSFVASSYSGMPVTNPTATAGTNSGNGSISINLLPPTAASVSISGRVLTSTNRGLMNAVVYLTDEQGNTHTARTNPFGYYRFEDISVGQTVIVTVVSKRYQFAPQVVNVVEDIGDLNFVTLDLRREK